VKATTTKVSAETAEVVEEHQEEEEDDRQREATSCEKEEGSECRAVC
jgi:hypothetical protein